MTGLHPHRVIARFDRIPADIPLETNAQMLVEFEGGIPGMIWTSQVAMGHETELNVRIFGEKGSIEWSHLKPMGAARDAHQPASADLYHQPGLPVSGG